MAYAPVVVPATVTVPVAAGVPTVNRPAAAAETAVSALLQTALTNIISALSGPWGVYDSTGALALPFTSFVSVSIRKEFRNSNAPTESGGFATYNKVETPEDYRMILTNDGLTFERAAFLTAVKAIVASTALYMIATPEASYSNINFTGYNLDRTRERSAGMISVELGLQQVRLTSSSTLSTSATNQPDGATATSGGMVQSTAVSDADATTIAQGGLY